jgi:hypothetical protein
MAFGKNDDPYARRDYSKDSDNPYARRDYSEDSDNPYVRHDYDDSDNPYARHYDEKSDNIYERHFKSGEEIKHESEARQPQQRQSKAETAVAKDKKSDDPYARNGDDPYARNYDPSSDNIYKKHIDEEGNDRDNKTDLQNDNINSAKVQKADTKSQSNKPTQTKMTAEQRQKLERLKEQNRQRNSGQNNRQNNQQNSRQNNQKDNILDGTQTIKIGEGKTAVTKTVFVNGKTYTKTTTGTNHREEQSTVVQTDSMKWVNHFKKRVIAVVILYWLTEFAKVLFRSNLFDNALEAAFAVGVAELFVVFVVIMYGICLIMNLKACTVDVSAVCIGHFEHKGKKAVVAEYEFDKTKYKKELINITYLPMVGEVFGLKVNPENPERLIMKVGSTIDAIYAVVSCAICIGFAALVIPYVFGVCFVIGGAS